MSGDGGQGGDGGHGGRRPSYHRCQTLMVKRQSLIGCLLGMVMHQPREREFISEIIDQVHRGQVSVPIDKEFPLSEAEACHRYAESRGRPMGRVLLIP